MQAHVWFALVLTLAVVLVSSCSGSPNGANVIARAGDIISSYPSPSSLCGENLTKETGTLNDLYYVFYEASTVKDAQIAEAPVILWLSGGPGCSGLVALFFENGPCSFDDETDQLSFNPHSWTSLAHVIYVDQPQGTGFSAEEPDHTPYWTAQQATTNLLVFLQQFFTRHGDLLGNDFYVFGESFAGHYVPDLALKLLTGDGKSLPTLKGIGIGNGVVSPKALADSLIPFAKSNDYGQDLLGPNEAVIQDAVTRFNSALEKCHNDTRLPSTVTHAPLRADHISSACVDAAHTFSELDSRATDAVVRSQGRNMYDMRRACHLDDPLGLCYRFSRLEGLVNTAVTREYFGVGTRDWKLCAEDAINYLAPMDTFADSEAGVACALEHDVRVLVYAGDADTMVNWQAQDAWTQNLVWPHQTAFRSTKPVNVMTGDRSIGQVRTSNGLSFMKIYNAGHMVPHDQPAVIFEVVRSFLYDVPGTELFT